MNNFLGRSCEQWRSVTKSLGGKELPTHNKTKEVYFFFFCRGYPVVLFLTVSQIQLLPSDTTNNIIIIAVTVGD